MRGMFVFVLLRLMDVSRWSADHNDSLSPGVCGGPGEPGELPGVLRVQH